MEHTGLEPVEYIPIIIEYFRKCCKINGFRLAAEIPVTERTYVLRDSCNTMQHEMQHGFF